MNIPPPENISPDALRKYLSTRPESKYLLVDVRQPEEYEEDHIPGATLIPVHELVRRLDEVAGDRELVFYCHAGGRSQAASLMAAEEAVTERIYNLAGGIMAWEGKTLVGFPRVQVFNEINDPAAALRTAMDLEKGALRFYRAALDRFGDGDAADVLKELAKAERAHARTVYAFWKKTQADPPEFDTLFDGLKGDILEGGRSVEEAVDALEGIETDGFLRLMEAALDIEYAAYDLYRVMVERFESEEAKKAFTAIAQAEKGHMRKIVEAIGKRSGG